MSGPYDDILGLPHHVSTKRPQMAIENRAAQFSPFAALTGHDAAVRETARLTDERITLDENAIADLDMKLRMLGDMIADHPQIAITYYQPDEKKEGGAYITTAGAVKKIDDYEGAVVLTDGSMIMIEDIVSVKGEVFEALL